MSRSSNLERMIEAGLVPEDLRRVAAFLESIEQLAPEEVDQLIAIGNKVGRLSLCNDQPRFELLFCSWIRLPPTNARLPRLRCHVLDALTLRGRNDESRLANQEHGKAAMTYSSIGDGPALRAFFLCDLVRRTDLLQQHGDQRTADLFRRHDRLARDLKTCNEVPSPSRSKGWPNRWRLG